MKRVPYTRRLFLGTDIMQSSSSFRLLQSAAATEKFKILIEAMEMPRGLL
jgi:hypothetical protein